MPIALQGATSGSVTLQAANVAGSSVLTMPAVTDTVLTVTTANNQAATAPTQQIFLSGSGTYTLPAGVKWLRVRMVGGGGGGGGGGNVGVTNGGAGSNTVFGTSFLAAYGGGGGVSVGDQPQSTGGSTLISTGASGTGFKGASGNGPQILNVTGYALGGSGGVSPFGGAGPNGNIDLSAGLLAAQNNTGSGGGGGAAGGNGTAQAEGGYGGAAGGYLDVIIASPSSTYTYTVGTGGTGGTSTNPIGGAVAGGAGGSGIIIVEEHYNY